MEKTVRKTLNFCDGSGRVYRTSCKFNLVGGIFRIYDCPAISNMKNCHISYVSGDEVFVQPKALDDGSEPDRKPYQKDNIEKFCATCAMKQKCER